MGARQSDNGTGTAGCKRASNLVACRFVCENLGAIGLGRVCLYACLFAWMCSCACVYEGVGLEGGWDGWRMCTNFESICMQVSMQDMPDPYEAKQSIWFSAVQFLLLLERERERASERERDRERNKLTRMHVPHNIGCPSCASS